MKDAFTLENRTILITGGGQGIGRALAECALQLGANVAIVDINAEVLQATADEIDSPNLATFAGDITREEFVNNTVDAVIDRFDDIFGLINNAGIVRAALSHDMTLAQWQQVLDVNLTGSFLCLRAVGQRLIEKAKGGEARPGSIINISSDAARRGTIGQINYGAAKSGMLGLTMCSAREWGRYGINVNSVCYGLVETQMTETIRQEKFRDKYLSQIPLGRFSSPQDVAAATCFFLTDAASYITGQHMSIDGGFYISS